jgi:hypothetical protein
LADSRGREGGLEEQHEAIFGRSARESLAVPAPPTARYRLVQEPQRHQFRE